MWGATKVWETHKVGEADAVLKPFHDLPATGRLVGYAGPPSRKAAEVVTKYIVVDMYAKAIQGMPAVEAAKWAHSECAKVYVRPSSVLFPTSELSWLGRPGADASHD